MSIPSYRYVTPVLKGRWCASREEALEEALDAGQAHVMGGEMYLFEFAQIEEQPGLMVPGYSNPPHMRQAQGL